MAKISSFEDIEVWKKAVELCEKIYLLSEKSPLNKDFGLRDQIRRSGRIPRPLCLIDGSFA